MMAGASISGTPVPGSLQEGCRMVSGTGRQSLHAAVSLLEIYKSSMNQYVKTVKSIR